MVDIHIRIRLSTPTLPPLRSPTDARRVTAGPRHRITISLFNLYASSAGHHHLHYILYCISIIINFSSVISQSSSLLFGVGVGAGLGATARWVLILSYPFFFFFFAFRSFGLGAPAVGGTGLVWGKVLTFNLFLFITTNITIRKGKKRELTSVLFEVFIYFGLGWKWEVSLHMSFYITYYFSCCLLYILYPGFFFF